MVLLLYKSKERTNQKKKKIRHRHTERTPWRSLSLCSIRAPFEGRCPYSISSAATLALLLGNLHLIAFLFFLFSRCGRCHCFGCRCHGWCRADSRCRARNLLL